jgi:NADPH:quinone reductase-like Zn-dependent oxidoreductase
MNTQSNFVAEFLVESQVIAPSARSATQSLARHLMRGKPCMGRAMTGLRRPKVTRQGPDLAGQVGAFGRNVTQFKPGDEVFGGCYGAFAELSEAPEAIRHLEKGRARGKVVITLECNKKQ